MPLVPRPAAQRLLCCSSLLAAQRAAGRVRAVLQMEAAILLPLVLGLLLLPLLAVLLLALCVRCRELPGEWGLVGWSDARTHGQGGRGCLTSSNCP